MTAEADRIDELFEDWHKQDFELPSEVQFIHRIARIGRVLGQRLEDAVAKHGLTISQFETLSALRRKHPQPLCAQDIMDASLLTSGSVTALINQLLKEGLVERNVHPDDKRRIQVLLTRKGTRIIEAVVRERVKDHVKLAQLLPALERRELNRLARRLLAVLEEDTEREESHG